MTKQVLDTRFVRESGDTADASFVSENRGTVAEAVGAGTGIWRIRIISAGQGASAYYPAAVLERDGRKAFPIGTKSYLNHPTMTEGWERPERDVEKICAKQVSEAEYDPTDQSLYANYQFTGKYQRMIGELYEVLGMSIYALAEYEIDTIGEYTGKIITSFVESPMNSVDVVTVAGANGAIIAQVSEGFRAFGSKGTSAQEASAPTPQQKESELDKAAMLAAFAEALAPLTLAVAALTPKPAESVKESTLAAEHELVAESGLPKAVRAVVYKAIEGGASAAESIASQNILVEAITADIAAKAAATATATEAAAAALAAAAGAEETVSYGRVLEAGATSAADHLPKAWS